MTFYNLKAREIREQKKIQRIDLSAKMGINRNTLWLWESGKIQPSERKIRMLANALDIPVDKISDLKPEALAAGINDEEQNKQISAWISFADKSLIDEKIHNQFLIKDLEGQLDKACRAGAVLRSLINFSDVMIYVKDASLKYIAASRALIEHLSFVDEQTIVGLTDEKLYPMNEAKVNFEEDEQVLLSAQPVKNREGFIPGSRKQKWGVITKIPTFDPAGKISGIVGSFFDITRRKKAEHLADMIRKSLDCIDKAIWLSEDINEDESGNLSPKKLLYLSNNALTKRFFNQMGNSSINDYVRFFNSMKLENPRHNLNALKEKGVSVVNYRIRYPDTGDIVNLEGRLYYDPENRIYAGIIERDKGRDAIDSISARLRELKVDEETIRKATALS